MSNHLMSDPPWLLKVVCSDFRQKLTIPIKAGFKLSFPCGITGKMLLMVAEGKWQESLFRLERERQ